MTDLAQTVDNGRVAHDFGQFKCVFCGSQSFELRRFNDCKTYDPRQNPSCRELWCKNCGHYVWLAPTMWEAKLETHLFYDEPTYYHPRWRCGICLDGVGDEKESHKIFLHHMFQSNKHKMHRIKQILEERNVKDEDVDKLYLDGKQHLELIVWLKELDKDGRV
jgi:hypothetical protein